MSFLLARFGFRVQVGGFRMREACILMHREHGVSCKREGAVDKDSGNNKDFSATLEMTIRESG